MPIHTYDLDGGGSIVRVRDGRYTRAAFTRTVIDERDKLVETVDRLRSELRLALDCVVVLEQWRFADEDEPEPTMDQIDKAIFALSAFRAPREPREGL